MTDPPSPRTLDTEIPELKPFLKPGIKVLDVGCGFGTITVDVATAVNPGEVVGIDPGAHRIETAQDWTARISHPGNVTFQVGDSHRLNFPDNTFDLVFSHTTLHFFLDPVLGLQEQQRVTKKGGWVIASGLREHVHLRHPRCPHWEKVFNAFHRYWTTHLEDYQASGKDPVTFFDEKYSRDPSYIFYYDMHAGRKCIKWFRQAGLTDIQIAIQPRRVKYQGVNGLKPVAGDLLVLGESKSEREEQQGLLADHQRMISMGLLDEETLEQATKEAHLWYSHPDAFQFYPEVFAAGRVL